MTTACTSRGHGHLPTTGSRRRRLISSISTTAMAGLAWAGSTVQRMARSYSLDSATWKNGSCPSGQSRQTCGETERGGEKQAGSHLYDKAPRGGAGRLAERHGW